MSPGDAPDLTSETVFRQYRERIYRHILQLVRDEAEAEDLTQETFLRAHRRLETLEDPAALAVWLYRIATHVCYDRFRQPSYRRPANSLDAPTEDSPSAGELLDVSPDAPGLDQVVERAEMSACVQDFLEELPDDQRTAVMLHDLHGLTNPEIAGMLGCSLETVKIRVHRARRRLKAALSAGCEFSHDERGALVCEPKPRAQPLVPLHGAGGRADANR